MLGLADKTKIIILLKEIFNGSSTQSIKLLKDLFNDGVDAKNFLNDILEILSLINRKLVLGSIENDKILPEEEIKLIDNIAKGININDVGLFWQYTLKTIEDLKSIGEEEIILEMYVLQLLHLKGIDSSSMSEQVEGNNNGNLADQTIKKEQSVPNNNSIKIKSQLKNTNQIKTKFVEQKKVKEEKLISTEISSFEDIVKLADEENEIELKYDLERNVKLVSFNKGKIDISFNEELNKNFIKILTERLYKWTGERWIISLNKKIGEKTIFEKKIDQKISNLKKVKKNDFVKKLLNTFEDAKLIEVESEKE